MACWVVTGGAGFIGTNAAVRLMEKGHRVIILDNLSRPGADLNLSHLEFIGDITFHQTDVRDFHAVRAVLELYPVDVVLHLAGQVAVTTSIQEPREDFEVNALGTFNVLEAIRTLHSKAVFINASTNKVYGALESASVVKKDDGYALEHLPQGIDEMFPLAFHSPYGCSKGVADQYTRDYGNIYGLRTVTLRQSCIYGPHQFGIEDQGWVGWFAIALKRGTPITIYGDGLQVRDLLFVEDLVELYITIAENPDKIGDGIYNAGGGPLNKISVISLLHRLEAIVGKKVDVSYADWRPGDQKIYVSNISKAEQAFRWKPATDIETGLGSLLEWIDTHHEDIERIS